MQWSTTAQGGEHVERRGVEPACAERAAQLSADQSREPRQAPDHRHRWDQQETCEGQQVGRDYPRQGRLVEAQLGRDVGQRDVDRADIGHVEELRRAHQHQQQPRPAEAGTRVRLRRLSVQAGPPVLAAESSARARASPAEEPVMSQTGPVTHPSSTGDTHWSKTGSIDQAADHRESGGIPSGATFEVGRIAQAPTPRSHCAYREQHRDRPDRTGRGWWSIPCSSGTGGWTAWSTTSVPSRPARDSWSSGNLVHVASEAARLPDILVIDYALTKTARGSGPSGTPSAAGALVRGPPSCFTGW